MDGIWFSVQTVDLRRALVAMLLAFGLAQAIAGVYLLTYRGLSYSKSVVQGMAIGSVVPCMLMLAIGSNLAAGLGVAGGLALIRFRTSLRDPRDILFVFAALGVGIACGTHAYAVAIAGTFIFSAATVLLAVTGYGSRREFDGLLRFSVSAAEKPGLDVVLKSTCRSFALVTLREASQGELLEHAYQVSLASDDLRSELVERLRKLPGVTDVSLLMQEPSFDL